MSLTQFCDAFGIIESVRVALEGQEIQGPQMLSDFHPKLYRKSLDDEGLNLTLGGSKNLWAAVKAWKAGYATIEEAESVDQLDGL